MNNFENFNKKEKESLVEKRKLILTDIERANDKEPPNLDSSVVVFNDSKHEWVVDGNHKLRNSQKNHEYSPKILDIRSMEDIVNNVDELKKNKDSNAIIRRLIEILSIIPNDEEKEQIRNKILKRKMDKFQAENPDHFRSFWNQIKKQSQAYEKEYGMYAPDDLAYYVGPPLSTYPKHIGEISDKELVSEYRDYLLSQIMDETKQDLIDRGIDIEKGYGSVEI